MLSFVGPIISGSLTLQKLPEILQDYVFTSLSQVPLEFDLNGLYKGMLVDSGALL